VRSPSRDRRRRRRPVADPLGAQPEAEDRRNEGTGPRRRGRSHPRRARPTALALGDTAGTELLAADKQADGTIALVVRFATILVAAAIVEQIVERTAGTYAKAKRDKPLVTGAVSLVLGVLIARVMDLYLLHNLGFFGTTGDLDKGIEASKTSSCGSTPS
jgi:hypothetical protein